MRLHEFEIGEVAVHPMWRPLRWANDGSLEIRDRNGYWRPTSNTIRSRIVSTAWEREVIETPPKPIAPKCSWCERLQQEIDDIGLTLDAAQGEFVYEPTTELGKQIRELAEDGPIRKEYPIPK